MNRPTRSRLATALAVVTLCGAAACASSRARGEVPTPDAAGAQPAPSPVETEVRTVVQATPSEPGPDPAVASIESVADTLFAALAEGDDGNLLVSPLSLAGALHMTMAGASGTTLDEMREALGVAGDEASLHAASGALQQAMSASSEATVEVANRIWIEQTWTPRILAPFRATVTDAYGAGLADADFVGAFEAARQAINQWVAERTRDKIPELVPMGALDSLTRLVLTNAVYFDADWMHPFDPDLTTELPFHAPAGEVQAPMMSRVAEMGYAESRDWQAVRLPYAGAEWDMIVLLPARGTSLDADLGGTVRAAAERLDSTRVALTLPKFTFRWSGSVVPALQRAGMRAAFGRAADFSRMADLAGTDGLYVSDVIHEAFVEVDEEGTEAAAATAVIVATRAAVAEPRMIEMRVDRPFYFAIRHVESGALLFVGRVVDPT